MSSKKKRGPDTLLPSLFPLKDERLREIPACMLSPFRRGHHHIPCSGIRAVLYTARLCIQAAFIASNKENEMDCPNCGSQNIQLRHVGKKNGRRDWRNRRGLAGLEGLRPAQ